MSAVCAYVDEVSLQTRLDAFFETVGDEDETLIFTDLLGGGVNQTILPYMRVSMCMYDRRRFFRRYFRADFQRNRFCPQRILRKR